MTEEKVIITICLFLWGCVGGFDWISDSIYCISTDIFGAALLNHFQIDDITLLVNNVETILKEESAIKIFNLDEAKTIVLEAFKNKSWSNNNLVIYITPQEFLKNQQVFDEAYKKVFTLLKDQLFNESK